MGRLCGSRRRCVGRLGRAGAALAAHDHRAALGRHRRDTPSERRGRWVSARRMTGDLGVPLRAHVLEARGVRNAEAEQEHVRLRVAQRPQPVVVFLPCRVPQPQVDGPPVDHDIGTIVVEDRRDVLAGKGVRRVADQQTRLTNSTVAEDDTFNVLHGGAGPRALACVAWVSCCLLYTSPSPRDATLSRMPSSA